MDNNNLHIVNTHGNGRHSESSPDLTTSSVLDNNHNALNLNKTDESLSSSSSVEPRSESSLTDPIRSINNKDDGNYENFYDDVANDNIEADRESVLSDFISSHMVPLPQISAEPASDEDEDEEDFISVASSRDAGWEDNWLFKKKKSNKTSSSVGMLVPAPKEDIRALIGDKPTDEISDLSEVGSDTDDSSLEMVSASLEPLNDRLVNKHLIGGKNTKPVLDEIADRTSMISVSSLPDNVPPFTETKNEFVISNDGLNESQPLKISVNNCNNAISNEAINSNVTKAVIATKVEKLTKEKAIEITDDESIVPPPNDFTDDEKMRNLLAKFNEEQNNKTDSGDDNSSSMSPRSSISCALSAGIDRAELDAYEGITDFSVEDEEGLASEIESSSRRPSVIEILAAIALGPMLAVSASDDRNMLTEVELSSLMELNELAMAQLNAKAAEDRRLGVIVEESFDSHCDDHNVEIVDVNEETDLLSSPKMVMDAIKELVGKDARRYSKSEESSVQIEEITEAEAEEFTEDSIQSKLQDKTADSGQGSSENEYDLNEDNKNNEKEDKHTTSETEPVVTEEILPSQPEDGTTKVEVHKNPDPHEIEDTFEIVAEEIVNKEETTSQCEEETIQPSEMKKELEPTDEPKNSVEPLDENQILIDEDNCNPMTSLSDDLGFEKIIPEDTSSISDESLHTIGSSPSECSDLEGDTTTFYNDEKINSAPAELTDDQKLQQSKENDKNTNEFILPPPTAFCDEELKKLNEDGGNIESSQVTEAHINSEAVQAETQMTTSANSTNEQEIKTNEVETHTENQCTDTKNTTEDIQGDPEVKEDKETVSIPEIEEVSISKEVLPQSGKLEEPPDKKSLGENQSKPEDQSSSEIVSTPEIIDNEPIQSSEIEAETQNQDSESKDVEDNTKLSTEETEQSEECKSTNLTEDQPDSTDLVDTQPSSDKSCEENSPASIPIDEIKQNSASDGNSEEVSSQETSKPENNAEIEANTSTSEVLPTDEQLEDQISSSPPINEASKDESTEESSNKEAIENLKEEVPENDTSSIKTEETSKQPEVEESNESSTIENTQVLQEDTVKTELEENVQTENKSVEIQEVKNEDTEVTKVNEETLIDNTSDDNVALTDDKTEVVSCSTNENMVKSEDEKVENSADIAKIVEQPKFEDVSSEEPTNDEPSNLETSVEQNEDSTEESASAENLETMSNVEEPHEDQIKPIEEAQQNEGSSEESASTENPEQKSNVEDQTRPTEVAPIEESDLKTTVLEGDLVSKQLSEDVPTETSPLAVTEGCTQDIEMNSAPNPSDAVETETTSVEEKVESSNTDIVIAEDSVSVKTTEELSPETSAEEENLEEKTTENSPETQISTSNEDVEMSKTVEGKDLNEIQAKPEVDEPTLVSSELSEPVQSEAESSVVNPIPTEECNEDQQEISKEINNDCELPPVAIPEPSPDLVKSKRKIVESPETPETADVASIEPVFPTESIDNTEEPIEGSSQAEAALENLATELLSETVEPVSTNIQKDEDPSEAPAEETEPAKGSSEIIQEEKPSENETIQSNEDVVTSVSEEKTELKENEDAGATSSTEVTNESLGNDEIEVKNTNEASENEVKSSDDVSTIEEQSQEDSPIADKSISEAEENKCEDKLSEDQKEDTLAEAINDYSNPQEAIQTSEPTNEIKTECSSTEGVSTESKEEENINQDSNKTNDEDVKEAIKLEADFSDSNLKEKEDCKTDDIKQVETEKSDPHEVDNATEDQTKVEEIINIPSMENTSIEVPNVDQVTEPLNKEEILEEHIESNVDSSSPVGSNQNTTNPNESSKDTEETNEISAEISSTEEPVVIDEPKTESLGDTKSSASEEIAEAVSNACTTDEEKLQKEDDASKNETPEVEVEPTKVLEADEIHEVATEPKLEQVEKSIDEIGEDKSKNESEIKTETIDSKEEIKEISTADQAEVPSLDNVSIEKVTEPLNIETEDLTKNKDSPTVLEEPILDKQTEDINGNTENVVSAEAEEVVKEVLPDIKTENPQEQITEAVEVEKTELGNVSTERVVIEPVTDTTDVNTNNKQQEKDDKEPLSTEQVNDQSTDGGTKTEEIEVTDQVSSDSDSSQTISETPQPEEPADEQEEVKSNEEDSESSKIEEITTEIQISDEEPKEESIATITEDSSVQPETSETVTESVLEVQPEVAAIEVTEKTNEKTTNGESEEVKIEKESSTQENVSEEQKGSTPAAEDLGVSISKTEESIPPGDIPEEHETQLTDAEEVQAKKEVPIDAEESNIEINPENQEQPAEKISEQESLIETQNAVEEVQEVSKEHQETKLPEEVAPDSQDQVLSTELPAQELKEELPAECEKVSEDASEPVLKTEDTPPSVQEEVPNDGEAENLSEGNKTSAKESEQMQKSEETEIQKNSEEALEPVQKSEETEITEMTEQTVQDVSQEKLNDGENSNEIEKIPEETKDSEDVSEQNQKIEETDIKAVTELAIQVVEDEKASEVDNLPETIKSSEEVSEEQQKLEATEASEIKELTTQDVEKVPETEKLPDETNNSEGSEPVQKSENTKIDDTPTKETPSVDSNEEQLLTVIPKQDEELTACADNSTETVEEDVPIEKSMPADEISEVSKSEELKSTEEVPSEQSSITEENNEEHKQNTENTKDAPIQSEEVQKEDKENALESQASIASEIVSNLQTDDEKIESITNVSESTLKTDDEKIEEMPVVESKKIEEPKVPEEINEDNIPVTTLNDQESVTDCKDVSADSMVVEEVIQKEDNSETDITISNNLESKKPEEADAEKASNDSDSQKPVEATQDAATEESSTDEAIPTENDSSEKRNEETNPEKDVSTSVQEISEETKPTEVETEATKTEESSTESEIKQKTPGEGKSVEEEVTENVPVPTEVKQKEAFDVPIESQNTEVKVETVSEPTEEIQEETVEVKSATDEAIESQNTDVISETVPEPTEDTLEEKAAENEAAESPNTDTNSEIVPIQTEVLPEKEPNVAAVEDTPPEIVDASTSEETAAEVLQSKEESSVPEPEEIANVTPIDNSTGIVDNQLTESSAQQSTEEAIACVEESQKADEIVSIEEASEIKPIRVDEPLEQSEDTVEVNSESAKTEDSSETVATEEPLKTDIIEVKEPSSEAAEVSETNEQESVTEVEEELVKTDIVETEVVNEANEQELVTEVKEEPVKTDEVEAAAESETNEQEVVMEVKEDSVKTDVVEIAAVDETNEQEPVAEVKEEPEQTDKVEVKESSPESAAVSAQELVTEVKEEPTKTDIIETSEVCEINEQELVTEATNEPVKTDIIEVKEPSSEVAAVSETNEQEVVTEIKEDTVQTDVSEPVTVSETNEQEPVAEVKEEPEITDTVEVKEPSVEAAADSETNEPELVTEVKEEPSKTDTADVQEPSLEAAAVSETKEQEPVTEVSEETINTEIVEEKEPSLEVETVNEANEASKPEEPFEASTAEVTPSDNINEPAISSVEETTNEVIETPKAEESTDISPNESSSKEDSQDISTKASEVETIKSDITNAPEQSQEQISVEDDIQQKVVSEVVQPPVAEADDDTDSEASFVSATEEELAETKNLIETAATKELPEVKTQKSELVKEVWKSLETEKEDESSMPQKLEDISIIEEKLSNIIDALQPEESLITSIDSNVAEEKPSDKDTEEPKTEILDENKKDLTGKIEEEFADAIPEPVGELISPTSSEDSTGTAKEVHIQPTSNSKEDEKSSKTIVVSPPDEIAEQKEVPVKDDKLNSENETVLAKPANDEIYSSSEAQPTEEIEVETKPSETITEIDAAQTSTEVTDIVESKEIEAKLVTKTPPNSLDCADAAIADDKTTPPFAILNATCKIITHPPLEKTESLIQSAQYLYEKMSDPILETTPDDTNAPNLAEELRLAADGNDDTKELPPNSERVIPQSKPCESLCFTTDPKPPIPNDSIATTEQQSNAQDASSSAQGSIAEREYKKWYNAVDMPNNPYSVEALRRRLSTGGLDRVLDLPNISPCVEDKPLQLCENQSPDADIKGQERDYARYSRDYYINDAKHASGITKKSPTSPPEISSPTPTTASSIELRESVESTTVEITTPVKELCHKLEKQSKVDADIYLATPVHVIEDIPEAFAEKNATIQSVGTTITSLTTEAVSKLSSDSSSVLTNASLTPSEDSDTIRIYDLKKQETRLVKETTHTTTITVAKSPDEKKVRPTELDITPTLAPPIATISSKSSTPTSFKFLQPKRKLINPSQVLSIDLDTTPITPCTPEKPVIEAEVAHAMPSVKALAKAFLMTSTTSTSENKWRKARAKSPLQFFKLTTQTAAAASTSKVTQKQLEPVMVPDTTSQGSEDATIASDLSSLETDPPSRIDGDTEDENQERVVLSGCLRNNIAFFENLKNK